ncbi:MAG: hypothetical protein P8J32_08995 [bacterium]|nr:hypothetical protein [bacterium]
MNLAKQKKHNTLVAAYLRELPTIETLHEFIYSLAMQREPVDVLLMHGGLSQKELDALQEVIDRPTIQITKENPEKPGEVIKEPTSAVFPLEYSIHKVDAKNFADVFNIGFQTAHESGYNFFSIAEPEDVYSTYWIHTAKTYAEENPNVGIFTPIIRNMVHGAFQGYYNEACWAEGMAEEAGKYDQNLLLKFNCLTPLGGLYRVSAMIEEEDAIEERDGVLYPMKSNIRLTSPYEFFLRMAYNDILTMNVPRLGYEQRILRRESYNHISCKLPQNLVQLPLDKGGVPQKEAEFWHKTATDAYFIEDDEPIEYIEA